MPSAICGLFNDGACNSKYRALSKQCIRKNVEGSSQDYPGKTEENRKELQSRQSLSQVRPEPGAPKCKSEALPLQLISLL
jgi:hypothetical protein